MREVNRAVNSLGGRWPLALTAILAAVILGAGLPAAAATTGYIVQGADTTAARAAVEAAGGRVTHELGIIHAVGAELSAAQLARLVCVSRVRLLEDGLATFDRRPQLHGVQRGRLRQRIPRPTSPVVPGCSVMRRTPSFTWTTFTLPPTNRTKHLRSTSRRRAK